MATTQISIDDRGYGLGDENDNLIVGDDNNNLLMGYDGSDTLYGYGGDDTLQSGDGADFLYGGDGNDIIRLSAGENYVGGGLGDDYVSHNNGTATINAGQGDDTIVGDAEGTTLILNDDLENVSAIFNLLEDYNSRGLYRIASADGTDWISGIDEIFFNDVTLSGTEIADTFGSYSRAGSEITFTAGTKDALYTGRNGNTDIAIGNTGDDTLSGAAMSDTLSGGDGDDFLNGGWGFDFLEGGEGADSFFHTGHTHHGTDWVADYSAAEGDVLQTFSSNSEFGEVSADDFVVLYATTEGQGDDAVAEAFIGYKPSGRILWALEDGADADSILIQVGDLTFDLLA